jgi:2-keto-4-pentenoate hydratase
MSLAQRLLAAYDAGSLMPLPSTESSAFAMDDGFAVADALRQMRIARGEKPVGYKIGFTNRSIWKRYGVHQPIWGPVWDSTALLLDGASATVSLKGLSQPRLEPEVVFGFARTPRAGMNLAGLQDCLDWVAHGFEIVHTHCEGWRACRCKLGPLWSTTWRRCAWNCCATAASSIAGRARWCWTGR